MRRERALSSPAFVVPASSPRTCPRAERASASHAGSRPRRSAATWTCRPVGKPKRPSCCGGVSDLRKRGWYAGDSHAHMLHGERTVPVDFDFVALTARAEDLQFLCLAQGWTVEPATPEALQAELQPRSTRDCLLTWNLEAPKNYYKGDAGRCLGHCWNLGMRGRTAKGLDVIHLLLEASAGDYQSSKPTYANFESHRLIHSQGGAVFYSHPARWWMGSWGGQGGYPKVDRMRVSNMAVELPLDTLAGPTYDGLDVFTGSNEYAANAKAFQLWSLLLDHGYRLAATASSTPASIGPAAQCLALSAPTPSCRVGSPCPKSPGQRPPGKPLPPPALCSLPQWTARPRAAPWLPTDKSIFWPSRPGPAAAPRGESPASRCCATGSRSSRPPSRPARFRPRPLSAPGNRERLVLCARSWQRCPKTSRPERRLLLRRQKLSASPARSGASPRPDCGRGSGQCLPGFLTEVTLEGPVGREGKRHSLNTGRGRISVPATVRLRAEAKGHAPLTLSPFLDSPASSKPSPAWPTRTSWTGKTFDRLREQLANIELVFPLPRPQSR